MPSKVLSNYTVTYNGTNITAYLNKASLDQIVKAIDTTNLASNGGEQTPGAPSATMPVGGMWAKALDDVLGADASSPPTTLRTLVVAIGPAAARVTYTWTGSSTVGAFITDYKVAADDPMGVIMWSGTLTISGGVTSRA